MVSQCHKLRYEIQLWQIFWNFIASHFPRVWQWEINGTTILAPFQKNFHDRYNSGEITTETMKERLWDTLRMSVYNSFITVKYNRLASPLENAPQASFQIDLRPLIGWLELNLIGWFYEHHFEIFSKPYNAKWPQHAILFASMWIKFLIPLIILLASVPSDEQYNPDFEKQMNNGQQVDYQLVYGITNDIHYLSYLRRVLF